MRVLTFDIETANWFSEVGGSDPADLKIALIGIHDSEVGYASFLEPELPKLWKILEQTDLLVGYNSDHFDIPLLNKYYPGDLSRIKSVDLLKDVELTKKIFDYALQKGHVKYKELGKLREVKLDTSKWLDESAKPMTFTMGF